MKPESTTLADTTAQGDSPLTAGQIATRIGRTRWGVKKALTRLHISAALTLHGTSYYPADIVPTVEAEMRKPNHNA